MTAPSKEALIEALLASRADQLDCILKLRESALLAVQQVNDVRITLLEQGPEPPSIGDVVFELYLSALLAVASPAVSASVKGILNSLLRTRLALRYMPKTGEGATLDSWFDVKEWPETEQAKKKYLRDIFEYGDHREVASLYRRDAEKLARSTYHKGKQAIESLSNAGRPNPVSIDDSPSVALLRSILESSAIQAAAIRRWHDIVLSRVLADNLSIDQTITVTKVLSAVRKDLDTATIAREAARMSILFEELIWISHFREEIGTWKYPNRNDPELWSPAKKEAVDHRLSEYWVGRLLAENGQTYWEKAKSEAPQEQSKEYLLVYAYDYLRTRWIDLKSKNYQTTRNLKQLVGL